MAANAKSMRYGNNFQVENCNPQQTVLSGNISYGLRSSSIRAGRLL